MSKAVEKNLRITEIINYTAEPSTPVYKKMLKGFLHKDSIADKEALFKCIEPVAIAVRGNTNCETKSEKKFCQEYVAMQIKRYKWTQDYMLAEQMPIEGTIAKYKPYRADFLNRATKTIIEINGKIHDKQKPYDRERMEKLNELGYTVIVFTNDEIEADCQSCCDEVLKIIERRLRLNNGEA